MRQLPSLGFALAILVSALPAAGPARAQETAAESAVAARAPDSGAVTPEVYDPDLAKFHKAECKKIARQIVQYTDVAARADDRGDALWEQSTVAHVDRLEARWNALCASEDQTWAILFNKALNTAGRLALKYFSMGWFD
jgi:hypothetical protein